MTKKVGIISRCSKEDEPYKSVFLGLKNAGKQLSCEIEVVMIDYQKIIRDDIISLAILKQVDGILLPRGFGDSHLDIKIYIAYRQFGPEKPTFQIRWNV